MGFALSILYFVTYYLTPTTLFGPLANYHIEVILAGLICLVSLPGIGKSIVLKTPQTLALIGLSFAVFLSVLIGMRWLSGGVQAFLGFIPNALGYFLICLNFKSIAKLRILTLVLFCVCSFVVVSGAFDLYFVIPTAAPPPRRVTLDNAVNAWTLAHPYILPMRNDDGNLFGRLRGPGEISDPNDFAQLMLCIIPLLFFFWRPKRTPFNIVCVMLPVSVLLFGIFLTHSRSALLSLMAVVLVAARRRIGTLPAVIVAGVLFVAATALNVSGGREISASAGSDRTSLWGQGFQMLKSEPLFGIGFDQFADKSDVGLTAHNSIVVCAAELGLFGLFSWSLFLLPTMRDAITLSLPENVSEGVPNETELGLFPQTRKRIEPIDKAEINRLGTIMVLSLTGFLIQGLFLSRAFVMTLFILGGMAEIVYDMAWVRGMVAPRLKLEKALWYTGGLAIAMVVGMYIALRLLNLLH